MMNRVMDKENTPSPTFPSPMRKVGYLNLDSSDAESQDSGFSSGSFSDKSCAGSLTPSINTGPSVRSTIFTDEDTEDGFMHMFDLDTVEEDSNTPNNLTSLFTKPIRSMSPMDEELSDSNQDFMRATKKRMCRRLSMTPDSPSVCALSASKSPLFSSLLNKRTLNNRNFAVSDTRTKTDAHEKSSDHTNDVENNSKYANSMDIVTSPLSRSPFKRPEPPERLSPLWSKRQKRSPLSYSMKVQLSTKKPVLQRCFSESEASIMKALQKSDEEPDLIGDFSKPYILPLINGRHQDMKTVTPQTLAQLMMGGYNNSSVQFKVVDCRYPYEFDGGHIKGALNIYTREGILSSLLSSSVPQVDTQGQRDIIIFHCEFSSERAPNLCRFLRNQDRECNKDSYPQLCHPEVYLLEGGYKAFFESFKELCDPQKYTPMLHKDHEGELRHFRAKSKSWNGSQQKKRGNLRVGKKFQVI